MSMTVSMILRLVDQVTGPRKQVIASVRQIGDAVDRAGAGMIAGAGRMDDAIRTQKAHLAGAAIETAGWAAALYAGIKPAVEFEAAMDKVGAISRADDADLKRLTETARELGATTPWAAREAAAGMEFLAMAGFDTNQIIATMPGMLNLASAAAMDLGSTADIASNILTGFGLEARDMGRVSDVMTNAFTQSNVDLSMLGETMKYVAAQAHGVGLSLEDTAAMVGVLGGAGVQGSMAGTALRAMLSRLSGPTSAASAALRELGVQTEDAEGNLRSLPVILAEIDAAMTGMGSARRLALNKEIFGEEAANAALILAENAGSGALQKFAEAMHATGTAAEVAARQNDNVRGMLKQINSIAEAVAITVGTILTPSLREIAETVIPILKRVDDWAQANPELVATLGGLVIALLGARMAMIGLRFGLLTLVQPFAGILRFSGLLLRGLGLLAGFNPFGILALAAVAAWYVIRDNWGQIVSWFTAKVDAVRAAFDVGFVQGLTTLLAEFNPFTIVFEALDGLAAYAGEKLREIATRIDTAFSGMAKYEAGKAIVTTLLRGAHDALGPRLADLRSRFDRVMETIPALDHGRRITTQLLTGMEEKLSGIGAWITGYFQDLGGPIIAAFEKGVPEGIGAVLATLIVIPGELMAKIAGSLAGAIMDADWRGIGASAIGVLVDGARSVTEGLGDLIANGIGGEMDAYGWAAAGAALLGRFASGADEVLGPRFKELAARVAAAFDGISLFDAGAALIRSLWDGAKSLVLDMVADLRARIESILPNWAIRLLPDAPAAAIAAPRDNVVAPPRAPITPADLAPRTTNVTRTGDIIVNAPEGADPKAIARQVKAEIDAAGSPAREQDLYDASGDDL